MEQGREVGLKARELYPGGVHVRERNPTLAAEETAELVADSRTSIIFEAAFIVDKYVARADILKRMNGGWHLLEVKSSVNDKDEFVDDMAYTTSVITRRGYTLPTVSLLLVSKDFRLGMDTQALFAEIDHSQDAHSRVALLDPWWDEVARVTSLPEEPTAELRFECRSCELFPECTGSGSRHPIFELPRINQARFDRIKELGVSEITDLPAEFSLTPIQERVRECVVSNQTYVGEELSLKLSEVCWPTYYLDFETVMTALPLYPDVAPYTQIPVQYSIHRCSALGEVADHREYLADPSRDCRRELAENLIAHLGEEGSIMTYSPFEKTIINKLTSVFEDLAHPLQALIGRIVDLAAIIRKCYYHPRFHGRTSIKQVLPILVPDMSYDGMQIADGNTAMATFAYMAQGRYETEMLETLRRNLLDYCKQDTMAMIRLHEALAREA